jgi:hypothetical protein
MKMKRIAFIYLLVAISIIFLFADFFHTETTLEREEQDDCPICIFERNTLAISQLYFLFVAIVFVSLFRFVIRQNRARPVFVHYHFNIRGPPSC